MYKDMERFEELKKIILERARNASACREQYGRAYRAENLEELMQVVRDNFWWACNNGVIDGDTVDAYRDEFATGKIWHNENITEGFLIASGSASVIAYNSASVIAYDSASVIAYNSASVEAYDSASVIAYDSASVIAYDSASVIAYNSASVEAYDSAISDCLQQRISGGLRQRISGGLRQRISGGLRQRICMFLASQGMSALRPCNLQDH